MLFWIPDVSNSKKYVIQKNIYSINFNQNCNEPFFGEWACEIKKNIYICFTDFHFSFLLAPVFIVQYLFDEAQILANNLINQNKLMNYNGSNELLSKEQWEYLYKLGEKVKQTLDNVT